MSSAPSSERRHPWLGIELRHLAALSAIESEGTFSDAALSLGYVQSAISGQVRALERLTGTLLVERQRLPGPQRLTPAGQLLLRHFEEIRAELDTARERLLEAAQQERSQLRVAAATGLLDGLVGEVLGAVAAPGSGISVRGVETTHRDVLLARLAKDELDVAIVDLPVTAEDIATAEVARDRLMLVLQAESPLARQRRAPSLAQLARLPLVAWREGVEPSRVEVDFAEHELKVIVRSDSVEAVLDLVALGVGAALLPERAAHREELAVIALDPLLPARAVGVAWHRSRSGDLRIRRFLDLACSLRVKLGDGGGDEGA